MPAQNHTNKKKIGIFYENAQALHFNKKEGLATANIIYQSQNVYTRQKV